jgi:Gnt-I system high-affinity gluconate transporter
MLLSVIVATFTLGTSTGKSIKKVMDIYGDSVKDVVMILLIVAGAGVLKQVFVDSGVSASIGIALQGWSIHPLVLGWMIAAVIRVCIRRHSCAGYGADTCRSAAHGAVNRRRQFDVLPCERCRFLVV